MQTSKVYIELKVKDIHDMFLKEVKNIGGFCTNLQMNVHVVLGVTRTLIQDICAFNKECEDNLGKKNEYNKLKFLSIETSLTAFRKQLLKIKVQPSASITYKCSPNGTRVTMWR